VFRLSLFRFWRRLLAVPFLLMSAALLFADNAGRALPLSF